MKEKKLRQIKTTTAFVVCKKQSFYINEQKILLLLLPAIKKNEKRYNLSLPLCIEF